MELKKIQLKDLQAYCESEEFKNFAVKPISPLRAVSYVNNPRADEDDVVLYLFEEKGVLLAFSLVFADEIVEKERRIRFGWGSGLWTNPDFRGKKLWRILLDEELKDWDGKIMFTNYAPLLQRIYCGSGAFSLFHEREGARFYLYPNLDKILKERSFYRKVKVFLPAISWMAKAGSKFKKLFYRKPKTTYREIDIPDAECWALVEKTRAESTFNRRDKELQWIADYSWVRPDADPETVFPFSYANKERRLFTIKAYDDGAFIGFIVFSLTNKHLKPLYLYSDASSYSKLAALIPFFAIKHKAEYLTILDSKLAEAVKSSRHCFVFHKKYSSHVYATFAHEGEKIIFDGDGDNCFT